jgi:uncharacterized protein involved in cysteine biosynthesis
MWRIVNYLNIWYLEREYFSPPVDNVKIIFIQELATKARRLSGIIALLFHYTRS